MSYPDLGCFAECLTCELCETGFPPPGDPPDLFPDEWPSDDSDPYGLGDWEPPPEEENGFDFDLPGENDFYIVPMDPFDGTFGGSFGGKF